MAFRPTSALGVGYAGSSASAGWLGATREASLGGYRSINDHQRPVYAVSRASALSPRLRRFSVTSFPEQPAETNLTELELRARAQEAVSRIVADGANAIVNLELGQTEAGNVWASGCAVSLAPDVSPLIGLGQATLPVPMPGYSPPDASGYSSSPSTSIDTPPPRGFLPAYGAARSPSAYTDAAWGAPSFALAAPPKMRARTPSYEPLPPPRSGSAYGYGLGLSVSTSPAGPRYESPGTSDWRFLPLPQ